MRVPGLDLGSGARSCAVFPFATVLEKTCFFFWENYGKDFERFLTLSFHGYHKVTPSPAAVGPALHPLSIGAGPGLGTPGQEEGF